MLINYRLACSQAPTLHACRSQLIINFIVANSANCLQVLISAKKVLLYNPSSSPLSSFFKWSDRRHDWCCKLHDITSQGSRKRIEWIWGTLRSEHEASSSPVVSPLSLLLLSPWREICAWKRNSWFQPPVKCFASLPDLPCLKI